MRDEVRWFFWECAGKKKVAKGAKGGRVLSIITGKFCRMPSVSGAASRD